MATVSPLLLAACCWPGFSCRPPHRLPLDCLQLCRAAHGPDRHCSCVKGASKAAIAALPAPDLRVCRRRQLPLSHPSGTCPARRRGRYSARSASEASGGRETDQSVLHGGMRGCGRRRAWLAALPRRRVSARLPASPVQPAHLSAHVPRLLMPRLACPQVKPFYERVCAGCVNADSSANTFVRQVGCVRVCANSWEPPRLVRSLCGRWGEGQGGAGSPNPASMPSIFGVSRAPRLHQTFLPSPTS